jgi:hypothetical protein
MMMRVSGSSLRMRRAASRPVSTGMEMSSSTTSGRSSSARWTAWWPSLASPTTSYRFSTTSFTEKRWSASSSASRIRGRLPNQHSSSLYIEAHRQATARLRQAAPRTLKAQNCETVNAARPGEEASRRLRCSSLRQPWRRSGQPRTAQGPATRLRHVNLPPGLRQPVKTHLAVCRKSIVRRLIAATELRSWTSADSGSLGRVFAGSSRQCQTSCTSSV